MEKKLILFIFAYKFKKHYIKRFELDELNKLKGYNVECHQLIDFTYPKLKKSFQRNDKHKSLKIFKTYKNWKLRVKYLRNRYQEKMIIFNHVPSVCLKSFKINNFLQKTKIKVLENYENFSSIYSDEKSFITSIKFFVINLLFNQAKIYNFFRTNLFLKLKKKIFKSHKYILNSGKNKNVLHQKNITKLEGNFSDFNMYLANKNKKIKKFYKKKIVLFLESATPISQGDLYISKDKTNVWGDAKTWFKNLNKFFEKVEKQFHVKVKIAPHPRVDHKNKNPDYYEGREIVQYELSKIAKYSEFFISRSSSAMCYAIIYNKPAIFITNNKIINGPKARFQRSYYSKFGATPINIDMNIDSRSLKKNFTINKKKYKKFKDEYLTARKDNKRNYEIISEII
jgi:hypothetical protein